MEGGGKEGEKGGGEEREHPTATSCSTFSLFKKGLRVWEWVRTLDRVDGP